MVSIKLATVPPGQISPQTRIEVRASIKFDKEEEAQYSSKKAFLYLYWDETKLLTSKEVSLSSPEDLCLRLFVDPPHSQGYHHLSLFILLLESDSIDHESLDYHSIESSPFLLSHSSIKFLVLPNDPSLSPIIYGAWVGLYHWSEREGKKWNKELKKFKEEDWKSLVRQMKEIGMDIIVIQEVFRNQKYYGKHNIKKRGYKGKAFYPSRLYKKRMPISAYDPIEAILSEADKHNMYVFLGIGHYAWFDFSYDSLEWHKKVMKELYKLYGTHPSLYGWYVSAEIHGCLKPPSLVHARSINSKQKEELVTYQKDLIFFFKELRKEANQLSFDMPIMLAPNSHYVSGSGDAYRGLLEHLNILCPFGFHRMPHDDIDGEEAAHFLKRICDEMGAHLWMDLETFVFGKRGELLPRPIEGIKEDLKTFTLFETILCYQFPGLFNAPWAKIKPGGPETVVLYENYLSFYKEWKQKLESLLKNRERKE